MLNFPQVVARFQDERGLTLIQLAIILPLILSLAGGVIDYGMILRENAQFVTAARIGARTAAGMPYGTPKPWFCVVAEGAARDYLRERDLDSDTVIVTVQPKRVVVAEYCEDENSCVRNAIQVTVRKPARWYFLSSNASAGRFTSLFFTELNLEPGAC